MAVSLTSRDFVVWDHLTFISVSIYTNILFFSRKDMMSVQHEATEGMEFSYFCASLDKISFTI